MTSRESIYAALFAKAVAAAGFVTFSRRIRHIEDLEPSEFPAIFQTQVTEQWQHGNGGMGNLPPIGLFAVEWWVYVRGSDPAVSHAQQLNPLIDALLSTLNLPPGLTQLGKQDLGGLIESVQLSGVINYAEGAMDDRGFARIPLAIKTFA